MSANPREVIDTAYPQNRPPSFLSTEISSHHIAPSLQYLRPGILLIIHNKPSLLAVKIASTGMISCPGIFDSALSVLSGPITKSGICGRTTRQEAQEHELVKDEGRRDGEVGEKMRTRKVLKGRKIR